MIPNDIIERAKKIKLLILDMDGVMTDGRIIYGVYGDELRFFNVQDGFGVTLLRRAGIKTVIITAKKTRIVKARARDLKVERVYAGFMDKLAALEDIVRRFGFSAEEMCFVGDDLIDLPVLKRVGLAVAVPNAVSEAREAAHFVTSKKGGRGAVREVCDLILKAQDKYKDVVARYSN